MAGAKPVVRQRPPYISSYTSAKRCIIVVAKKKTRMRRARSIDETDLTDAPIFWISERNCGIVDASLKTRNCEIARRDGVRLVWRCVRRFRGHAHHAESLEGDDDRRPDAEGAKNHLGDE